MICFTILSSQHLAHEESNENARYSRQKGTKIIVHPSPLSKSDRAINSLSFSGAVIAG